MLFILNPYAGMRRANRYLPDIIAIFNRADFEVITYMTAGHGDATRIAEEKAREVDLVVCAGGDGTFNETITGILRAGVQTPVGYIPCGSTNDFATSLKLSTNVLQAARDIAAGEPHFYDAGRFGDRFFAYVASFGAFTKASYKTPQNVKNALGHTAYLLEGIQEISQIRKEHIRIELEDRVIEDDFLFGAVSNSTSVAGILTLDPRQVDMCDGRFELLLVRAPKDFGEISECIRALQTQKYNCAMVTFVNTAKLRVISPGKMPWTLDGEGAEGRESVEIENLHNAICLMEKRKK